MGKSAGKWLKTLFGKKSFRSSSTKSVFTSFLCEKFMNIVQTFPLLCWNWLNLKWVAFEMQKKSPFFSSWKVFQFPFIIMECKHLLFTYKWDLFHLRNSEEMGKNNEMPVHVISLYSIQFVNMDWNKMCDIMSIFLNSRVLFYPILLLLAHQNVMQGQLCFTVIPKNSIC